MERLCRFELMTTLTVDSQPALSSQVSLKLKYGSSVVSVVIGDEVGIVQFNFHRDVSEARELSVTAREWQSDLEQALRMAALLEEQ